MPARLAPSDGSDNRRIKYLNRCFATLRYFRREFYLVTEVTPIVKIKFVGVDRTTDNFTTKDFGMFSIKRLEFVM